MDVLEQLRTRLADRYVLEHEIGRGGMATVYLARDIRHNRKVALKVLNPELGAVLGVERFLAEIQVTANLQHPNLLPLFDSGEADGLLFYVMPFIEGESLRALLLREKQLPVDDAIRMMSAVLSALDYAHRQGVIHRDLKPENILVHEGQPLVADFGIALAVSNAGGNRITQTGLSLGTPHYMSPEQATGDREIDGRTDVYSAGAVLYEMLVGEPPHDGKTSQAVIAKVLTDKPRRIRLTRETVPPQVEDAVDRALAKLPADRFHSAQEFADAIGARGGIQSASTFHQAADAPSPGAAPSSRRRALLPWTVAAVATLLGIGVFASRGAAPETAVMRYEISPPENAQWVAANQRFVAAAPNGKRVAFAAVGEDSVSRLYLREIGDVLPREVSGTEGAEAPFFSPDGEWLGFWAGGQLRRIPVAGGRPLVVADLGPVQGTWSESGWILAVSSDGLYRAPANGGDFRPVAQIDSAAPASPIALPGGTHVMVTLIGMGGSVTARLAAIAIETGELTRTDLAGVLALGVVDGNLLYVTAAGGLMAVPFDLKTMRPRGAPLSLGDQVWVDAATGAAHAAMAADGSIIYLSGVSRRQLVRVLSDGSIRRLGEPGAFSWPRLSPDGQRLAVTVGSLARRQIHVAELSNLQAQQITNAESFADRPEWTPDGQALLFRSGREGSNAVFRKALDFSASAELLHAEPNAQVDEVVISPDGRWLAMQLDSTGNGELLIKSTEPGAQARRFDPIAGLYGARFSPDSRWLAYAGGAGTQQDVFVRAVDGSGGRVRISSGASTTPVWSRDGRYLYFVRGRELVRVPVLSTDPFRVGPRQTVLSGAYVFNTVHADYDVAADGSVIAMRAPNQSAQMIVVRNIGTELKERFRTAPR